MEETSYGFGAPVDESLVYRFDRQLAATDIGRITKMLALSAMMIPIDQLDNENELFKYCDEVNNYAEKITKEIIGEELCVRRNDGTIRYFSGVPEDIERYADYAGFIIAKLIDGVIAARFYNENGLKVMKQKLEEVEQIVSEFNKYANNIHKIADMTIIDNNGNIDKTGGISKK